MTRKPPNEVGYNVVIYVSETSTAKPKNPAFVASFILNTLSSKKKKRRNKKKKKQR